MEDGGGMGEVKDGDYGLGDMEEGGVKRECLGWEGRKGMGGGGMVNRGKGEMIGGVGEGELKVGVCRGGVGERK